MIGERRSLGADLMLIRQDERALIIECKYSSDTRVVGQRATSRLWPTPQRQGRVSSRKLWRWSARRRSFLSLLSSTPSSERWA